VKHNCGYLFMISFLLLACIPFAAAEGSATVAIGFGSTHAKAAGSGLTYDYDSYGSLTFPNCTLDPADPTCLAKSTLDGFLLGFGADVMPWNHYGFGFNLSFMPVKREYGWLKYRETFYEFNGIIAPIKKKRMVLKLMGGIGGAKTGYSYEENSYVGSAITSSTSTSFGSSNHFQLHAGAGVEIYLTKNMFVRPQFDFRHITNFKDQFGTNDVLGGMVWVGFRTGGQ
jgi:opacity protein-like surface antigen